MTISVLITSYNYEKYIKEAIESVRNQTFKDWELIIVDDASSDKSLDIIKEAAEKDNRIKVFCNKKNIGLTKTLQKALEFASGEWIGILESDDMWASDYLAQKIEVIHEHKDAGIIFNDVEIIGDDREVKRFVESNRNFLKKFNYPRNMFWDMNLKNRIVTFSSVMIRKDLLEQVSWNTPSDRLLDWWLYILLAYSNKFFYIDKKLTKWRIHSDSYINRKNSGKRIMTNVLAMIEVFKKNPSCSLMLFIVYTTAAFTVMKLLKKLPSIKK